MDAVLETPRDTSEVPPELGRRLIEQLDGLADLLATLGIAVFRPSPLTDAEKQYLNYLEDGGSLIFIRDPMLAVANQVVELAMRPVYRRKEIFSLRALLSRLHESGLAGYFAMPAPAPQSESRFLEGGDVLLAGRDVLVGVSGKASDARGVQWLQRNLGPAYRVHTVPLKPDILHLDLAVTLLRPGLAIVDPAALIDGLPPLLQGWDLIELSPHEAEALAANVLVIDPRTVIVEASQSRLMRELAWRGITPLALPFDAPILMEGGFRCATHPLQRTA
jgi:N-dimethylarginine dimethylaminohydrolase